MTAVHQFLATFAPHDAVGAHAVHAQRVLRGMGLESDLYAGGIRPAPGVEVRPYSDYRGGGDAHLLYHLSTGSEVAEFLRRRPEPLVLDHHNVTPPRFVERWDPAAAAELVVGECQLRALAPAAELGLAVSEWNRRDLEDAGCRRTAVAPVLVDLDAAQAEPDRRVLEELLQGKRAGSIDWLFVGRLAPHKCQHDVVAAFAAYRRLHDPHARLRLVGAPASPAYAAALGATVERLGLAGAVDLTGPVSAGALGAHYRAAGVLVCLSDHEGFCVPLLEAMAAGVPVVAYAAGAVPETVGDAALLLPAKDPLTVAEAVHRVAGDERLRAALVAAGRERVAAFGLARAAKAFEARIAELLAG
ncbi:MAG TPA: glycosyltransferase [Acidimicrobiales bacterium]|nr:glycosyltransferase [Acidimicrobiales bacterium]